MGISQAIPVMNQLFYETKCFYDVKVFDPPLRVKPIDHMSDGQA